MLFAAILCLFCSTGALCAAEIENIVRRSGDRLVVGADEQEIWLRGIGVGNYVWQEAQDTSWLYYNHSQADFDSIAAMGMNVVRFYMNYETFEDDSLPYVYKQTGWGWLDSNITWAQNSGLYLNLNMHVPQGGFQSGGGGLDLWTDPENQNRFVALWQEIARRYATEPVIAGFGLLNEPTTTESREQWQALAQRTADSIRAVDPWHLLIVECIIWIWENYEMTDDPAEYQFLIDDDNTMYEFHTYRPHDFVFDAIGEYPDTSVFYLPDDLQWHSFGGIANGIPTGDSDWIEYTGELFTVADPFVRAVQPVFFAFDNQGTIAFDDFSIIEYDPQGQFVRELFAMNISDTEGWSGWSNDGNGVAGFDPFEGHGDSYSLTIHGAENGCGWAGWNFKQPVRQGYSYQIRGWMRGEGVSDGTWGGMRLDFYCSPSGEENQFRNRELLENHLLRWRQFGLEHNVPMYVGEFGCDDRVLVTAGGLQWVEDMVELLTEHDLHFTYHLYENVRGRSELINWFTRHPVAIGYPTVKLHFANGELHLSWNAMRADVVYYVESAQYCGGPWTILTTTQNNSYSMEVIDATRYYRVRARLP